MGKGVSFSCCAFLALTVLWTPALSNDACNAGCKGSATGATFQPSHKYTYSVEGVVDIFLTAADKQQTSAKLNAQVTVTSLGNCAYILRVNSLHIAGPDGKKHGSPSSIEKPVRFTLENGLIGAELCSEDGDHQRSLNIKRAIISLLATSKKQSSEVDVFGVCPTEASSSHEGGAELVHRSRDLSRCGHREKGKHDLLTSIYNNKAEIKSTNILQSTLHVETKVKNGIPEKVSATEEYLYTPFSVGQNGARARVATKLALTGQSAGSDTGAFKNVKSIIFENPHPENTEHNNQANVLSALKSAAQSLQGHASSKSASIFGQLVKIFRVTSKDDLLSVFGQIKAGGAVKDNNLIKKVFLDALLRSGTGDSIEVSIKLLQGHELSDFEQKLVFLSLGNARHASSGSITAAATLLDQPNLPKEVYLGVGALAGVYCREHSCHGSTTQAQGVADLAQKFAAKIGNCKAKNKAQEDTLVAVLKGVRNVRHIETSLVDKLIHCVTDHTVKSRVKVAALEAFHADPCTPKLKKTAIDAMKNRQLDSEIRIKAYLALLECPCSKGASEIKNLLETEPVQQVGRFITSSLAHIRASANPDRELAKQHFGQIRAPQKFKVDARKYSSFHEYSYNIDSLGLGATGERTVVFSQDSFLPRSASLNLTTQLFGHSFNILELGVRQGNLDRVLEHFFGPKGFFKSHEPQEVYDTFVKKYSEVQGKFDQHLRGRRAVQQEIANFAKQVKGDTNAFDDELDLDIVVKIFGTDSIFLSLGDDQGFSIDTVIEKILKDIDAGAKQLQHFSQELRAHVIFLDAELAYPTSVGLPLKLNLVGSATARIEIGGSVDVHQIAKNPNDAKIDLKFVPSTNVEIAGTFTVDADVITTGLKVVSNLHSSTGGHLIAKVLENGKGFDLQFGLPIEKQELFTFTNDLVFATSEKGQQETEVALKVAGDNAQYKGCFDQLSGAIGLTFCGDLSVPFKIQGPEASASFKRLAARYPLTGPSKLSVFLEKNDLKNYHVKGLLRNEGDKNGFELVLEAEGTKTNRKTALSGEFVNTDSEKRAKLSFESPIKTASAEIAFVNNPSELSALVKVAKDTDEYYGRFGFSVAGNQQRSVYTPLIEYKLPGSEKQNLQVEGQVIRQSQAPPKPGFKYTFNGLKVNMPNTNEKVLVDGFVANEVRGFSGELKAVKGDMKVDLKGTIDVPKYHLELQNTINPNVNFKFDLHSIKEEGHYQNDLNLVYGPDLNSNRNKLTLNQNFKYDYKSPHEFSVITKNHIACPALEVEVKADGEFDPKKVDVDFETKYQNSKAELELEARTEIKNKGDYIVKFEADLDDKGVSFLSKRDIVSEDKSNFENVLTIKPGGKYELSGVVNHKVKKHDMNVGAVGHLKVAGKNEDIKFDFGVISNPAIYNTHVKLSAGSGELVNLLVKIHRGSNPNGQLVLNLKDTITANGQFKATESDGKGNGVIVIDFKKLGRKVKSVVDFVRKEPQYNANVDVFLDFDKDNNNKIHLSTQTNAKPGHLDTRNQLVIGGQKTILNIKSELSGAYENGKNNGFVELVLPNERTFTFKMNRESTTKDKVANAQVEMTLSDAPKRGGAGSTLAVKNKMSNLRIVDEIPYFDYSSHITVNLIDGKNLAYAIEVKNNPGESASTLDFKTDVTGSLIPQPASLSGTVNYKDSSNHIDGDSKYKIKGNYGSDFNFALEGNEDVHIVEEGDKKYVSDYALQLSLPFDKAHDIKLTANSMFFIPKDHKETIAEYQLGGGAQINADVYKIDTAGKFGLSNGYEKIKVVIPHNDPFTFDTSYHRDVQGQKKSGGFEIKSSYGKGKSASIVVESTLVSETEYALTLKANAPQAEKLKKLEVSLNTKRPDANTVSSHVIIDADGKVYKYDSNAHLSRVSPLFDVQFTYPQSDKPSKLYFKGSNLNNRGGKVDFKFENVKDTDLVGNLEVDTANENINIKLNLDSPKLKLDKYHMEIVSKDAGNGKRLEFQTSNNGKNVLSGSTSFVNKQEGSKTIIEGSGTLKVNEEQKSATFKYIRDVLSEGQEQGVEEFINVAVGDRSIVIESRNTNLELKHSQVYCEEKKQCAHAEFNSKINVATPGLLQNTVNIVFDLRKLGFSPEFGLQMSSEVGDSKLPQYLLDVHLNQDQNKYYLHAYSQPAGGAFPAGVTLTLPKRVIALESTLSYPQGKTLPFPIKGEAAFYLDKKHQPKQKAAVRLLLDVTGTQDSHSAVAEVGLSHPTLDKEILAKYDVTLAHPKDSFKFDTTSTLSHPAFGSNKVGRALFEVSPTKLRALLRSPLVEYINVEGNFAFSKELQKVELTVALLQGKKVDVFAMVDNFKKFEFSTGYRDQDGKLTVVAEIRPQEHAEVSTDLILGKEKKNMFRFALTVQDNLVKPEYSVSADNFKYFANAVKNDIKNLETRLNQLTNEAQEKAVNEHKRISPVLEKLAQSYKTELAKLKEEVVNDKALQDVSKLFSSIVNMVVKILDDIIVHTTPIVEKINADIKELFTKTKDLYDTKIAPQLKMLYENISTLANSVYQTFVDLISHFVALIQDFLKKHEAEFQELTNIFSEMFKDLNRLIMARCREFRVRVSELFEESFEKIQNLPVVEMLKEKFAEFQVPEQLLQAIQKLIGSLESLLPNEETKSLAKAIDEYIEKKLTNAKVDDKAELRVIYEKLEKVISSYFGNIRSQIVEHGVPTLFTFNMFRVNPTAPYGRLPILGSFSFSPLNYFKIGDFPSPLQFIRAYTPRGIPSFPQRLSGVVVNGQHIFTFDGRHLTFPGSCRYVLAHDHGDSNFTLAMQLQNGAPKAIVLTDKSGTVIEIKENGQLALNGANHGFPARHGDAFAFKTLDGKIGLGSTYGVMAFCAPKLTVCYVDVNGYYLGKVRGLLGDGNNEEFDDFRMPNGKIANNEAEFGNSYRLAGSCPQVKTPEHHHDHGTLTPACELIFGGSSTLTPFFYLLDPAPFKQACSHATASNAANAQQEACDIGAAYVLKLGLPALLPSHCVKCHDGESTVDVGVGAEYALPKKQADIVVAVELTKGNEHTYSELVVPLVGHVVDQLKQKKIDDVKVYLVGVTSEFPYPLVYDIDNAKLKGGKPQFTTDSRYNKLFKPIVTKHEKVDYFFDYVSRVVSRLQNEFDIYNIYGGYNQLGDIPYRPAAVKTVISLVSETCTKAALPFQAIKTVLKGSMLHKFGISNHVITVTPDIKIGDGKQSSQIIGFDDSSVLILGDKKRGMDSQQLRQSLSFAPDSCIEFVERTKGTVFSSTNFNGLNAAQKKQFSQAAAHNIVDKLLASQIQTTCRCVQVDSFKAKNVCVVQSSQPATQS